MSTTSEHTSSSAAAAVAKPAKLVRTTRLQSHFVAFLTGLTVAGFYAGSRFKDDLGGFAGAISKLQGSVDEVAEDLRKVKELEAEVKQLHAENEAQKRKIEELTVRVNHLQ